MLPEGPAIEDDATEKLGQTQLVNMLLLLLMYV